MPGTGESNTLAPAPSPSRACAWATRCAAATAGTLLGVWAHSILWPTAPAGNVAAFAGALGLAAFSIAELVIALRTSSSRRTASGIAAHNERLVRTFFEHTPTAVAMLDRDLRYIVHSRAWTREYALGDVSLVGRHHYDVFDIPDRWKDIHQRCLAGAIESSDDDEFTRPDGQLHNLRWDCRPWYDADGTIGGLTFMTQDISAAKRVESERAQHNQQLLKAAEALTLQTQALGRAMEEAEAANRAKSEFLANISHEIRTPLTAILGYTQFLKDPAIAPLQRADALDRLSAAGQHLATLLDDVLDLTKIEAGRMGVESIPTDPASVAREAVDMFMRRAAEKGLHLAVAVDADVPARTLADPTRLRQIVANLVGNAIKFTPAGSVVVQVRRPDPGTIAIEVSDTGIGIEEANLARLFQPFTQADGSTTRRFGGTGLGLRISRKLATLMGGDLAVSSRFNHGSTFTLHMPFVDPGAPAMPEPRHDLNPAGAPPPAPAPAAPASFALSPFAAAVATHGTLAPTAKGPFSGRTVLVVDDAPDNLLLAATHLRRAGATVTCAEGGAAALKTAAARAGRAGGGGFDIVLLDLHMPEVDGYAVLEKLRTSGFTAPIVAFTAYSSNTERARALEAGFDAFVSKPFTPAAIIEACQRAIAAAESQRQRRAAA